MHARTHMHMHAPTHTGTADINHNIHLTRCLLCTHVKQSNFNSDAIYLYIYLLNSCKHTHTHKHTHMHAPTHAGTADINYIHPTSCLLCADVKQSNINSDVI